MERIGCFIVPGAEAVVAGRNHRVIGHVIKLIAGKLLTQELVVWLVIVERTDDVITILPGIRLEAIALETIGFGEANQIEPVAGPLFAIVRRCEQRIDEAWPGV